MPSRPFSTPRISRGQRPTRENEGAFLILDETHHCGIEGPAGTTALGGRARRVVIEKWRATAMRGKETAFTGAGRRLCDAGGERCCMRVTPDDEAR